jgi:hypothetical protein
MNLSKIKEIREEYRQYTDSGNIFLRFLDALIDNNEPKNIAAQPNDEKKWKALGYVTTNEFMNSDSLIKQLKFKRYRIAYLINKNKKKFEDTYVKIKAPPALGNRILLIHPEKFKNVLKTLKFTSPHEAEILENYRKQHG